MPLFLKHQILFIHIPKCGGDSINFKLSSEGDHPLLFVDDGSVMVNGHTPQHMTYREFLQIGWPLNNHFRVAALVRHPIERVMSEFRYLHLKRPDITDLFAGNPSKFLDYFLSNSRETCTRFDNHNLGLLDFLSDDKGIIDERILIRPTYEMATWLRELGLPEITLTERRNVTKDLKDLKSFSPSDIQRIKDYYCNDIAWFEKNFPLVTELNHHGL